MQVQVQRGPESSRPPERELPAQVLPAQVLPAQVLPVLPVLPAQVQVLPE